MNAAWAEPLEWSPRKRWILIMVAVLAQVGLIFWFSASTPRPVRNVDPRPVLQLVPSARSELFDLNDPTLFARPHPHGFSARAWLVAPAVEERGQLPASPTPPAWLALAPEMLGASLRDYVKPPAEGAVALQKWLAPALTTVSAPTAATPAPASVLQLDSVLAARGLVEVPRLPAWPHTDILAPSEVQVLVDARGNPVSALLLTSSGLPAADQAAVKLAQSARFGSDPRVLEQLATHPAAGLVSGRMIFRWQTLAPTATTNGSPNPR